MQSPHFRFPENTNRCFAQNVTEPWKKLPDLTPLFFQSMLLPIVPLAMLHLTSRSFQWTGLAVPATRQRDGN